MLLLFMSLLMISVK